MFVMLAAPGTDPTFMPTRAEVDKRIRQCIGRDDIPIKTGIVQKWQINDLVATCYSDGNM